MMAWLIMAALGGCVDYELQGEKQVCAALQERLPKVAAKNRKSCKKIRVSIYKTASGLHLIRHRKGQPPQDYLLSTEAAAGLLLKSWSSHGARGPLLAGFEPPVKPSGPMSPLPRIRSSKRISVAKVNRRPREAPVVQVVAADEVRTLTPDIPRPEAESPVTPETIPVEAVPDPIVEIAVPDPVVEIAELSPSVAEAPAVVVGPAPGSAPAIEILDEAAEVATPLRLDRSVEAGLASGQLIGDGPYVGLRMQGPGLAWNALRLRGQVNLWQGLAQRSGLTRGGYQRRGVDGLVVLNYEHLGVPFGLTPGLGLGVTRTQAVRNQDCSAAECAAAGVQITDDFIVAQWALAAQAQLCARVQVTDNLDANLGIYLQWWPGQGRDAQAPAYADDLPAALAAPLSLPRLPQLQAGAFLGARWHL